MSYPSVNVGIQAFKDEVLNDPLTALRAEIAVVAFNHEVNIVQDFVTVKDFKPSELSASGGTKIAGAINLGLNMIAERKRAYRTNGIPYFRPIVLLITDGYPEHDSPKDIEQASERIKEEEAGHHVAVFSFGVDDDADLGMLATMMSPDRPPRLLQHAQISGIFQWLAASVSAISQSQPGDRLRLPAPETYLDF